MKAFLLGLALLGAVHAIPVPVSPPKVEAHGHFNTWTFDAAPGALVARHGGKEVWRVAGPLKAPVNLQLLAGPGRALLLSRQDGWRGMDVVLSAYRLESGKLLWTRRLYQSHGVFDVQLTGTVGRAVVVSTGSGKLHRPDVTGFDLASGDMMWWTGGELLGRTDTEVLVVNPGVGDPNQTVPASAIPLVGASGSYREAGTTYLPLKISARAGCGEVKYQNGFPDLRFTSKYLYALRQDACGKFIARFDWHVGPGQTPLVYPDRRPPTPRPPSKLY